VQSHSKVARKPIARKDKNNDISQYTFTTQDVRVFFFFINVLIPVLVFFPLRENPSTDIRNIILHLNYCKL